MKHIAASISQYLAREGYLDSGDIEVAAYGIECRTATTVQSIILIVSASLLGKIIFAIIFTVFLVRSNSGQEGITLEVTLPASSARPHLLWPPALRPHTSRRR